MYKSHPNALHYQKTLIYTQHIGFNSSAQLNREHSQNISWRSPKVLSKLSEKICVHKKKIHHFMSMSIILRKEMLAKHENNHLRDAAPESELKSLSLPKTLWLYQKANWLCWSSSRASMCEAVKQTLWMDLWGCCAEVIQLTENCVWIPQTSQTNKTERENERDRFLGHDGKRKVINMKEKNWWSGRFWFGNKQYWDDQQNHMETTHTHGLIVALCLQKDLTSGQWQWVYYSTSST